MLYAFLGREMKLDLFWEVFIAAMFANLAFHFFAKAFL